MFEKTKKWNEDCVCSGTVWMAIGCPILVSAIEKILSSKDYHSEELMAINLFFLFMGVAFFGLGVALVVLGKDVVVESRPFDYTLKESLQIKINRGSKPCMNTKRDANGLKIENSDSEEMVDYVNFKKGDTIKIKTIEEHDISTKNNWRNARVYAFWKDELVEIPYEETTKQGIDELLMSMYQYK